MSREPEQGEGRTRVAGARRFFLGSLALSVLLAALLASRGGGWTIPLVLLALFALGSLVFEALARRAWPLRLLLTLAALNAFTVVPELVLRLVDFRHAPHLEAGYPDLTRRRYFEHDSELFWKSPTQDPAVNSLGFRGRELEPKTAGVRRVLFLGDSCAALGRPTPYPMLVEERLNEEHGEGRYESVIMAVAGYSSYQGLVAARKYASLVEADLVFVCFGWNDHWQASRAVDAERASVDPDALLQRARRKLRLLHFSDWLLSRLLGPPAQLDSPRVPPEHFRSNLQEICGLFRDPLVPVVLVTAPTSHYALGVPAQLIERGYAPDERTVVERHRAYAQIVREVAEEEGAILLDLERSYQDRADLAELFLEDGVHFTERGYELVAEIVSDLVARELREPAG
jgi:lysophospholipase L1-like esterase